VDTPVTGREHGSIPARLALALSAAMTPALVATATMALIVWRFETGWRAIGFFALMGAFGSVFGMALAVIRARRKGVADVHIHERRDRPGFFAACAVAAAFGWGMLLVVGASIGLLVFMGAYCVCLGVIALTTLVSKPSVHCATMAAFTGALLIVEPIGAVFAGAGLAALIWARLYRKRHTLAQCVFGIVIGAAIVAIAYLVWRQLA
jgi:hypothetical protein